jgi:rod shape-determining protein MreC
VYKNRVVVVVVFAIISFFIFRHFTAVGASVVEAISSCILYPFLRVQQLVIEPIMVWQGYSVTIKELEVAVDSLQKERNAIFAENIALKAMHHYADETNELREFSKKYLLSRGRVGQVLARHFSPNNQFFLIDAGSSHGIKKDMVALYCNAIVGKVTSVYPWYCKVCLITDADCKIASLCLPSGVSPLILQKKGFKKSASGIHEGINNGSHTAMRYVSHLEAVNVGDDVFSSGEGLVFPKGFALGKVVAADKGELFYTITIQPALDFQTLRYCTLVAKEDI